MLHFLKNIYFIVVLNHSLLPGIRIFPNPMKSESHIQWENTGGEKSDLFIYDLKGTIVRTEAGLNSEEYILKRESLSSGCYIMELKGSNAYHGRLFVD